jgi:hypothetical protein
LLSAPDRLFIEVASAQLGISLSECVRRLIHESRLRWIECGLYTMPQTPERSVPGTGAHGRAIHREP